MYRVSHDTGHPKIWLSARPFIDMDWNFREFPGVQCRWTPCSAINDTIYSAINRTIYFTGGFELEKLGSMCIFAYVIKLSDKLHEAI